MACSAPADIFLQPELLARTGLRLPPLLELAQALRAEGWPVEGHTVAALRSRCRPWPRRPLDQP